MTTPDIPVDTSPVLAAAGVDFDDPSGNEAEQALRASCPQFRDMRRVLPAERMRRQMELARFAASLPESMRDAEGDGSLDLADFDDETATAIAAVFERMQDMVLNDAADRDEMTEWLLDAAEAGQGNEALQIAFSELAQTLGN